jgi:hypothetical protein
MALGVSVVLLPFAPALIALWLGWLGLIFIDRVPGGRPPAWDAGEAVPWPPAGQQRAGSGRGGTVEGTATEVGERPNPPRQPGERRKRKRRR